MAPEAKTQNKRYLFYNLLNIMDEMVKEVIILHSILLLSVEKVEISALLGPGKQQVVSKLKSQVTSRFLKSIFTTLNGSAMLLTLLFEYMYIHVVNYVI